jgi:hypothetical protein
LTLPTDDFANSLSDATHPLGQVALGELAIGALETTGDRDWFSVQLEAGTSYLINLQGQHGGAGTLDDPYLRLHDSSGALLAENDDIELGVNRDSQLIFTASTSATYYLEAGGFNDSLTGTYTVLVSSTGLTDDFRNSLADQTAPFGQVEVNGSALGSLEASGDRDWFRVQLVAGTTYVIDLQGQHAGTGTLEDPLLRLHDGNGTLIAQNDDVTAGVNRDSQLTFTAAASGVYYIEAGGFNDDYVGTYQVNVTATALTDDFADSLSDTTAPFGPLAVNGSASGNLESVGDRDWFQIQLNAGTSYVLALQGLRAGSGTLQDPYLRLHDASGAVIAQNDDILSGFDRDSQLSLTVPTSGTYYLEAGAFNDAALGTYRASVTIFPDDFRDTLSDATAPFGQVAVNGAASGNLEFKGDRDWFQIQLTAGGIYVIDLQGLSAGGGTLDDPYLRLHDANGSLLAENDDIQQAVNLNSELTFTAPSSGTYYLEAGGFADDTSGTYTVRVTDGATSVPPGGPHLDVNAAPYGDFDANGRSDLLWRNDNGQIAAWQTNSAGILTSAVALGSASADWHIDGTGDFNHDGQGDILFRNEDQRLAVWQTNGQQILSIDVLGSASSAWHSAGIGDFNGDGTGDLLFRNDNGEIAQWLIKNNHIQSIQVLGSTSSSFHIVGISDFNGDGKSDLLFRDDAGVLATWILNGNQLQSAQVIGTSSTDWHLVGTGDFNGDHKTDLLWHNDNGQVAEWLMNGSALQSIQVVGTAGLQYHLEGTGDFNGDGKSDILLRDNAGTVVDWLMNGAAIQTAQVLGSASGGFHLTAFHFDLI